MNHADVLIANSRGRCRAVIARNKVISTTKGTRPMKRLRTLTLFLGLTAVATSSIGCANFAGDLAKFQSYLSVAEMVITAIQTFGDSVLVNDPTHKQTFDQAVAQAEAAAAAAANAANGASDLSSGNVTAAFQAFEDSYSSLVALAQSFGVKVSASATKVGAEKMGDVLIVPPASALRPAMVKAPGAVSLRSPGDTSVPAAPEDRPPVASLSKCDSVDALGGCYVHDSQSAEQEGSAFGVIATPRGLREWGGAAPASHAAGSASGASAVAGKSASPANTASNGGVR